VVSFSSGINVWPLRDTAESAESRARFRCAAQDQQPLIASHIECNEEQYLCIACRVNKPDTDVCSLKFEAGTDIPGRGIPKQCTKHVTGRTYWQADGESPCAGAPGTAPTFGFVSAISSENHVVVQLKSVARGQSIAAAHKRMRSFSEPLL
jgi:hypothetical protein